MAKYALITHHDKNYQKLADFTWNKNKIPYAEKYSYDYHAKTDNWVTQQPDGLMTGFEKIYLAKQTLEEHPEYEWILWTGTDVMVTNTAIRIEDRIDNNYHFIASVDILGLNVDTMLIRNSNESMNFINSVLDKIPEASKYWDSEQRAINYTLGFPGTGEHGWPSPENLKVTNEFKNVVKVMPQRYMNAFNYYLYSCYQHVPHRDKLNTDGNWQFGDWLIHWPATSLEYRQELAEFYNQSIVR
jgi:hypothetical protein